MKCLKFILNPFADGKRAFAMIGAVAILLLGSSCANLKSTELTSEYNTRRNENSSGSVTGGRPRMGSTPLLRYYLPIPYIQVYAYEIKVLGKETIRFGARAVALPDLNKPILLDNNFSFFVKHDLQVELSDEGFLRHIAYNREPQAAQAVGKIAQTVASFMSPVPFPFKGDGDFPEFSRLIFQRNYSLMDLLEMGDVIELGPRKFSLIARLPGGAEGVSDRKQLRYNPTPTTDSDISLKRIKGVYHRPLIPIEIEITQTEFSKPNYRLASVGRLGLTNTATVTVPKENISAILHGFKKVGPNQPLNAEVQVNAEVRNPEIPSDQLFFKLSNAANNPPIAGQIELRGDTNLDSRNLVVTVSTTDSAENNSNAVDIGIGEVPLLQQIVVFAPDPAVVDAYYFPTTFFAKQSAELWFSGGSVSEVRAANEGELMGLIDGILGPAKTSIATVNGIFTVNVNHRNEGRSSDDGKGTGNGSGRIIKE
jgi:hypothetical protein